MTRGASLPLGSDVYTVGGSLGSIAFMHGISALASILQQSSQVLNKSSPFGPSNPPRYSTTPSFFSSFFMPLPNLLSRFYLLRSRSGFHVIKRPKLRDLHFLNRKSALCYYFPYIPVRPAPMLISMLRCRLIQYPVHKLITAPSMFQQQYPAFRRIH